MMRKAKVYMKNREAGILEEIKGGYVFEYNDQYYNDASLPEISLTLPKSQKKFNSEYLFPFFFSFLSEGENKSAQCRLLKIDEEDYFGLLLATANNDTLGAITIKEIIQ